MTTCLGKSCSFGLPRVPFVNCHQLSYFPFGFEGRIWDLIVSVTFQHHSNWTHQKMEQISLRILKSPPLTTSGFMSPFLVNIGHPTVLLPKIYSFNII